MPESPAHQLNSFGGEMGARIRALDWSKTPLGPMEQWPASMRGAVNMMLRSKIPIAFFCGADFVVMYNDAYRPVFGAKHPWALATPGHEAWREIWDPILRNLLQSVVDSGEAFHARDMLFLLERHGFVEETYFDVSYDPVADEDGRVVGVYCIVSETTGRVVGERRVALLRDLAAHAAAARTPAEACVLATETLAAHDRDVRFAQVYFDNVLISSTRNAEQLRLTANASTVRELEFNRGSNGTAKLVIGVNPERPLDAAHIEFLEVIASQISAATVNAQAYEAEVRRAEALAELDRAKTSFFTNVSHEFRTPLTLMLGPLEDLHAQISNSGDRKLVETAQRNAERLLKLVNSLLEYARMEGGQLTANARPVDLAALTADLASTFRSACERAGLELVVDTPPLPQPVYVEPEHWEKIVLNLVSNAFKFTLDGKIVVSVRADEDGGCAELAVSDTGVGIPANQISNVFNRFHRVDGSAARSIEGSGIGLALTQELVKLNGGTIAVRSEAGQGSTFVVRLPFGDAHLAPTRPSSDAQNVASKSHAAAFVSEALRWLPKDDQAADDEMTLPSLNDSHKDARILIADDNTDMREYLERILERVFKVELATDGAEALARATSNPPDLILCDVMMPHIDGLTLASRLRQHPETRLTPIVLLSARADEDARAEGLAAGADDYIVKPFSARELRSRIAAHLSMAQFRRESDAALRVNEEKYRSLLSSIDEGFCIIEILKGANGEPIDYRFVEANSVFEQQTGLSDAMGKTILELVPNFEFRWIERYAKVAESGEAARWVDESVALGRWYDVFADRVGGEGSALVAVLFRDITERKRRETNAHLLEEISKDLMTLGTPDEIMQTVGGRIGRALKLSAAIFVDVDEPRGEVTVHYGWASGEAPSLKQTFTLRDYLSEDFNRAARAGETVVVRDTYNDPIAVSANYAALQIGAFVAVPFHWEGKWTEYFAAINIEPRQWRDDEVELIREVSDRLFARVERARAEQELRKSQAQLRQDLEDTKQLQVVSGLLNQDDSGHDVLLKILDAAMVIMNASFGSIQLLDEKRHVLKLLVYRGFDPVAAQFWNEVEVGSGSTCGIALRHGERSMISNVFAAGSGVEEKNQRWYAQNGITAVMSTPLTTRDGYLVGMISTHWAVEHAATERELRMLDIIARQAADFFERIRGDRALKEANRRKDEFLATLAHELRNPLAPIRNGAELLRLTGTPAQAQVIDIIDRQTTQLVRLVDDLMEVSRITRGKIEMRFESLDLKQVLRSAVETAEPVLEASQTRFTLDLPSDAVFVSGDSVRLGQIFTNLLNNAAKYTEVGGRIALVLECAGGEALVRVRDTGTGIPAEMLPRVFDLFTQVDRTLGRAQGGLGIGLALVKSLVEAHGGQVEAFSDGPGRGSEFVVRLPLIGGMRESTSGRRLPKDHYVGALSGKTLLVVDDNRDAANTMAMLLRHLGAQVVTAYGGRQALQLLESMRPAMMFVDLGMPGMDGCTLAQNVRRDAANDSTVLVALTGWGQEQDVRRARAAGFDHHLVKPADARRVMSLMTHTLAAVD